MSIKRCDNDGAMDDASTQKEKKYRRLQRREESRTWKSNGAEYRAELFCFVRISYPLEFNERAISGLRPADCLHQIAL
jgi:hypothetical protein